MYHNNLTKPGPFFYGTCNPPEPITRPICPACGKRRQIVTRETDPPGTWRYVGPGVFCSHGCAVAFGSRALEVLESGGQIVYIKTRGPQDRPLNQPTLF